MIRLNQLRGFAEEVADRVTGSPGDVAGQIESAAIAGFDRIEGAIGSALARLGDLIREDGGTELPQSPPFEGGQCEGVEYQVSFSAPLGVPPFNQPTGGVRAGPGPVNGLCFGEPNQFGNVAIGVSFTDPSTGEPFCEFNGGGAANTVDGRQDSIFISDITRSDGQSDDCGNPAPEYEDDQDSDPIVIGDDGEISGPDLPSLPDGWRPRICGIDLELPCPGLSICAGGFRVRVGPCGLDIDLDPRGFPDGGGGIDNTDPETIGELDGGAEGDDEISVGDDVVSVWIETTGSIPDAIRVTHVSGNPERVERWLGFASTGTDTGTGRAYSSNVPLHYGRNYYRLDSDLESRSVKVRSPVGVTWVVTDTGERCDRCNRASGV